MATYTFDHVHIISPNPEAAAQFYVEKFGAVVKNRGTAPDGTAMIAVNLGGGNIFVKGRAEKPTAKSPAPGTTYGLEHFGIVTNDLDAAVRELKAKGVVFKQDITNFRPGIRISFLLGPDDTLIELLERKPV